MPQVHVPSCPNWIRPPGSAAPHSIGHLNPLRSQPSRDHDGGVLSGVWSESFTSVPSQAGISSAIESPIFCIEIFQAVKKKPHLHFLRLITMVECCCKYVLLSRACRPRPSTGCESNAVDSEVWCPPVIASVQICFPVLDVGVLIAGHGARAPPSWPLPPLRIRGKLHSAPGHPRWLTFWAEAQHWH